MLSRLDAKFDSSAIARGCPNGSVKDYLALLVNNGSDTHDGDIHRLQGGCGPFPPTPLRIDPPAEVGYWFCTIDAYSSDPQHESPWHYQLHLRVHEADRAPDLATVACPGE